MTCGRTFVTTVNEQEEFSEYTAVLEVTRSLKDGDGETKEGSRVAEMLSKASSQTGHKGYRWVRRGRREETRGRQKNEK